MKVKFSYWLFLFIFYFSVFSKAFSQKEASIFLFNNGVSVDFKSNPPLLSNIGYLFAPATSIASICNSKGELLFYTNGINIYDSKHSVAFNGSDLKWSVSSRANMIIVPAGIQEKKYYLITADARNLNYDKGNSTIGVECCYQNDTTTSYTVLNVDKDKKVSILQKNIPLLKPGNNLVAATKHANGIDTWVVTMEYNTKKFYAFLFTECGVETPVISDINIQLGNADYLAFSPNGTKLVATLGGNFLMDFDNSNGVISNPFKLPKYTASLAFSPNSRYLYSHYDNSNGENLEQFDIINKTSDSLTITSSGVPDSGLGSCMSPAIDGKIYFNGGGLRRILSMYDNPDEPLNRANLKYNLGNLTNSNYLIFPIFPNYISNYFDPNYSSQQVDIGKPIIKQPSRICEGDTVLFEIDKTKAISEYIWSFGDGESISNEKAPKYCYKHSGQYSVKLIVKYNCEYDTLYSSIIVDAKRIPLLEDTIYSCKDIELKTEEGYISYYWNTGENSSVISVSSSGIYTVELTNACGVYENIYNVIKPETQTYNLITPNGDSKNEYLYFKEYPLSSTLEVYNRWGVRIFNSENYRNNWPEQNFENGLYYYKFNYSGCTAIKGWVLIE